MAKEEKMTTRERIVQTCIEMLGSVSLESMRTQDLILKAGVSRSSFYRLFLDKYEVANSVYQEKTEEIIAEMPELKMWKEWTHILHGYMRENRHFFKNIAGYQGQNSFKDFLCLYFENNVKRTQQEAVKQMTDEQLFAIHAFSLVGAQATVDWIMNGFQPDEDTLLRRLDACIPACVRFLYE